jgi:hypothetical protein
MARSIVATVQRKGGVGKTTIAVCLSSELHARGNRVTLIDADPQQSSLHWAAPGSCRLRFATFLSTRSDPHAGSKRSSPLPPTILPLSIPRRRKRRCTPPSYRRGLFAALHAVGHRYRGDDRRALFRQLHPGCKIGCMSTRCWSPTGSTCGRSKDGSSWKSWNGSAKMSPPFSETGRLS